MIRTLLAVGWWNLKRDVVALGLTFVLPVVFFSIFAVIFSGMGTGGGGGGPTAVIAADEDGTPISRAFLEALGAEESVELRRAEDRERAASGVRRGDAPVAVVVPAGFAEGFGDFTGRTGEPVEILYDEADPMAWRMVSGLCQRAAMVAAPDAMMERGLELLEQHGGPLTPEQRRAADRSGELLRGGAEGGAGPVRTVETNVRADGNGDKEPSSMVAYYAAGIGVMFLLFSMAGAAGSLLEEEENGTLERVLASRVGMGTLLAARWAFFAVVGLVQVVVMFLWGAVAFDLTLFTADRLAGFVPMAVLTARAAAAFGILLATLCRSRAQLGGTSTIVILVMSALGGSMVPRFVMPDFMDTTALFTFNGWALDGFLDVFWYGDPDAGPGATLLEILPELGALAGMTVGFLLLARLFARRWETA